MIFLLVWTVAALAITVWAIYIMCKKYKVTWIEFGGVSVTAILLFLISQNLFAHPGGLNSEGCHNQTDGEYHCHNSDPELTPESGMYFTEEELRTIRYCLVIACSIVLDGERFVRRPDVNAPDFLDYWLLYEPPEDEPDIVDEPPPEAIPEPVSLQGFVLSSGDANCADGMSWHYQCGSQTWTDQSLLFVAVCANEPAPTTCISTNREWRNREALQSGDWVLTCPIFIASGNRNSCLDGQYFQQYQ